MYEIKKDTSFMILPVCGICLKILWKVVLKLGLIYFDSNKEYMCFIAKIEIETGWSSEKFVSFLQDVTFSVESKGFVVRPNHQRDTVWYI